MNVNLGSKLRSLALGVMLTASAFAEERVSTAAQLTELALHRRAVESRSSLTPGLAKNADGSVDLYFAPKAPERIETNWVPTNPAGKLEVLFCRCGSEKPFFEKTWRLPDVERVK